METDAVNLPNPVSKTVAGGLLIAFEGIDGCGKTTMARRTADELRRQGYKAVYLREPTDGPHGRRLREIMLSSEKRNPQLEFDLFLLDRQQDVQSNIVPALQAGGIVCIDRYYISSMAYQGALGLDPNMIQHKNEQFAPAPDLILRYVVSIETALKRISTSRSDGANQFETQEYLEKVNQVFDGMNFPQMQNISADQTQDDVFKETWNVINNKLRSK